MTLKFKLQSSQGDVNVFASFKNTEPTLKSHDFTSHNFQQIKINQFKGENLFISMISHIGCEVQVLA
jgi:hypothetical protein